MRSAKMTLTVSILAMALTGILPLLGPPTAVTTPYLSALSDMLVATTQAAAACEEKKCEINSAGSQSKCVASAGTSCKVDTVHGRGHGRICQTLTCF